MAEKKKRGRPSKLDSLDLEKIEALAQYGLTQEEIANVIGVADSTLRLWKKNKEFSAALKKGQDRANAKISRSLYLKALGHIQYRNNPDGTQTEIHVPGETVAMIFWLKNRLPGRWRDKQDIEHGGEVKSDNRLIVEVVKTK